MKRLYSLLAILGIIFAAKCTRVENNDNPIIGIWNNKSISTTEKSNETTQEWIFNDAHLGRYQKYDNRKVNFKTDFKWSEEDGIYTITYPETNIPTDKVSVKDSLNGDLLAFTNGNLIATREY